MTGKTNLLVEKKSKLTDGIQVIFLTLLAYVSVGAFEVGYIKFYQIPTQLMTVDISTLIVSGLTLLSYTLVIFMLLHSVSALIALKIKTNKNLKLIMVYVSQLLFTLTLFAIFKFSVFAIPIFAYSLALFILNVVYPLFFMERVGCWDDRLTHWNDVQNESPDRGLLPLLMQSRISNFFTPLFLICTLCVIPSGVLGYYSASQTETYPVMKSDKVVLKIYGNNAITARLIEGNKFEPNFKIIDIKSSTFKMVNTGKLSIIDIKENPQ